MSDRSPGKAKTEAGEAGAGEEGFSTRVIRFLDGGLVPEEMSELNTELRTDAAKRKQFTALCFQSSLMVESLRQRIAALPIDATLTDAMIMPALVEAGEGGELQIVPP